jgi:beta-lactamase regulating signal transducer with metallopeptidase domain
MGAELLAILIKLNLAVSAAILLVLLSRRFVRRQFGARLAYALWTAVPLAGAAVLLPAPVETAQPQAAPAARVARPAPAYPPPSLAIPASQTVVAALPTDLRWMLVAGWLAGAVFTLLLLAGRQARFVATLGRLRRVNGLWLAERPGVGPAVVGALFPRIVLPADFAEQFDADERRVILAHERNHLASGDAQVNALAALLQGLLWCNPLVHLAVSRLRIDQEIACDAAVLARFPNERRRYGEVMLKTQLAPQALPLGCRWPPAKVNHLKERIGMLKSHRHGPVRRWTGAAAVATASLGIAVAAWAAQPPRPAAEAAAARPGAHGQALFIAVREGDTASVEALIAEDADVNARLRGDGTPLIEAARVGREDLVSMLLAAGADPNLPLQREGNPLIVAAAHGHLPVVRRLVEAGAKVDAFVVNDETPLINAARSGRVEVVAYLIDRGADVNLAVQAGSSAVQSRQIRSPLSEARRFGRTEVIDLLIARGARA